MPPSRIVVAVHGVGDAEVGSTLSHLSRAFPETSFRGERLIVDGQSFACLESESLRLVEMNWADVLRPTRSWLGIVEHLVRLAYCMLYLAAAWDRPDRRPPLALLVYRVGFEVAMPWLPMQALVVMLIASFPGWKGALIGLIGVAACGWLCRIAWSISIPARVAGVVTTALLAALAAVRVCVDSPLPEWVTKWSTMLYGIGDLAAGLLLLLATAAIFVSPRGTADQRAVRWLIAVLPFMLVSFVGSTAGLLALVPAAGGEHHQAWQETHLKWLWFDLLLGEVAMAAAFLGAAGLVLAVVAGFCVRAGRGQDAGRWVQDRFPLLARAVPCLLMLVGVVVTLDSCGVVNLRAPVHAAAEALGLRDSTSVINVYAVSASRLASLLPFLIAPVWTIAKVIGDVVFYAAPARVNGDARDRLKSRMGTLLDQAGREGGEVLVVSHSQGTAISLETLATRPDAVTLLTMGSPIESLYKRFLGPLEAGVPARWINLYRNGDVIAGEVEGAINQSIGPGGHTGYWGDGRVHDVVRQVLRV